MKRGSTFLLRLIVLFIGLVILALCVLGLPSLAIEVSKGDADFAQKFYPILFTMYITAVPFFIGLYQGLKILTYIDKKTAFSALSVLALKRVKYCAIIISALYAISLPFFFMLAQQDDAPGIVVIGLILTFAAVVVATFAAVLQKLLQDAVALKFENDLTV